MSKYTPGPWRISQEDWSTPYKIWKDEQSIALVNGGANSGDYSADKANAYLMAAAPEMLSELLEVRKYLLRIGIEKYRPDIIDKLNAVISKAESGEK